MEQSAIPFIFLAGGFCFQLWFIHKRLSDMEDSVKIMIEQHWSILNLVTAEQAKDILAKNPKEVEK